jgi:hypothetical protein
VPGPKSQSSFFRSPLVVRTILSVAMAGPIATTSARERQVTHRPQGHILTNTGAWSPDGNWILYDTRSDPAGAAFDGATIEAVHVDSGEVRVIYRARNGAYCGVATFHPTEPRVVFILGPEHPTPDWSYNAYHRRGVVASLDRPGEVVPLDARDIVAPFTPGALRGGSHVHVWDPSATRVSFTYEDHVLAVPSPRPGRALNQRNVGVTLVSKEVAVPKSHPRNHDGHFSVLVTQTAPAPRPGSDEIVKACEEGWVGTKGYSRQDETWQRWALAFQGSVITAAGTTNAEVFIADLPEDLSIAGDRPLEGTPEIMPQPPRGTIQRRLTFTAERKYPGLQGPRHWLRSSPDGASIFFLMKDDAGVVQLHSVSPVGGAVRQVTRNSFDVASAFTISPDGKSVCHVMDNSICVTDLRSGNTRRVTAAVQGPNGPRPEACVFSPDGRRIAYVRPTDEGSGVFNQIFVVEIEAGAAG